MLILHLFIAIGGTILGGLTIWFLSKRIFKDIEKNKKYCLGTADDSQHASIIVNEGFWPNTVLFEPNRPIKLNFIRENTSKCSEEIVIPALNKRIKLEPFRDNIIELKFAKAGAYSFKCGMGLMNGKFIIEYI